MFDGTNGLIVLQRLFQEFEKEKTEWARWFSQLTEFTTDVVGQVGEEAVDLDPFYVGIHSTHFLMEKLSKFLVDPGKHLQPSATV